MATVDNIRNSLIEKILTIRNKKFLLALDSLVTSTNEGNEIIELTEEQILMLELSDEDIKHGRIISEEILNKQTDQWLKSKVS